MKRKKVLKNFDKEKQVRRKEEKGITLIALVITIIVLLILAGVSIATLTGDNGILTKANKAKEETEKASGEEQRELAMIEATMNDKETTFQGVKIPAGFAPTKIEGESIVDEGLVIVDSKGNSYVWIEVPKTEEVYQTAGLTITDFSEENYQKIENDLKKYTSEYREERESKNYSDNWKEDCKIDKSEYNRLKSAMLRNIYKDGGFWIGRYEVGYEGEVRFDNANNWTYNIEKEPVVKEGAYPFNYLCYPQAQKLAKKLNYGKYEGSLMFGIQWDLVCKFIEENSSKDKDEIKNNSISWGNYRNSIFDITKGKYSSDKGKTFNEVIGKYTKGEYETGNGILLTTGATKRNSVLNIYDFAGNLWEYTLEFFNNKEDGHVAIRGGAYSFDGTAWSATGFSLCSYGAYYDYIGFRTTLIPIDI